MLRFLRPSSLRSALLPSLALLGFAAFAASPAQAILFTLDTEFDAGLTGNFATVEVTESGGGLDFIVSLAGSELGPNADLHEFYFNLAGDPTNVTLTTVSVVNTAFTLQLDPPVAGGAGSSFEYGVNFGNGAGPPGNGVLKEARFRIEADQPLSLSDLEVLSQTAQGIQVHAALHVQGTSLVSGSDSETVGGTIPAPEPGALGLLGGGLLALAVRRRS
jgi:hypothetical protein